jgi:transposase
MLSRQVAFNLFKQHGPVAIDNNTGECALRSIGIGQKNWLFSRTNTSAKTLARAMTIIETTKHTSPTF